MGEALEVHAEEDFEIYVRRVCTEIDQSIERMKRLREEAEPNARSIARDASRFSDL